MSTSNPDPIESVLTLLQNVRKLASELFPAAPEPESVEVEKDVTPEKARKPDAYLRTTTLAQVVSRHEMGISVDSDVTFLINLIDRVRNLTPVESLDRMYAIGAHDQQGLVRMTIDAASSR